MAQKQDIDINVVGFGTATIQANTTILELKAKIAWEEDPHAPVVGALHNNRVTGLEYKIKRKCSVQFLTIESEDGADLYRRSLSVLLHAAFIDIMDSEGTLKIEHSMGKGYYYTYLNGEALPAHTVRRLEDRMRELVDLNIPFQKREIEIEEATDIFHRIGAWDRYYLVKYGGKPKAIIYKLGECCVLSQGPLVPSTGLLKLFSLMSYPPGLILIFPESKKPRELPQFIDQKKLFQIYSEQREWSRILQVDSVGKLNRFIIKKRISDLIWLSEGLHEKKIANIADFIRKNAQQHRIVFLAGPSSSGKTTFAKRLTIQLLANGISPKVINLDHYYLPRDRMPKNEHDEINYDSLYALDLELIREQLGALLEGRKILIPHYDFKTGYSEKNDTEMQLKGDEVLIIEGIHGMNRKLAKLVGVEQPFKIYISALTQLNIDVINRIPTATVRLIRRIVRDCYFRYSTARQTIAKWPLVRQGEEKNIFPFQEEADVMFNSSLVYEMSVLKGYVEPLLRYRGKREGLYKGEDAVAFHLKFPLHFT
jgi:uridine kinase